MEVSPGGSSTQQAPAICRGIKQSQKERNQRHNHRLGSDSEEDDDDDGVGWMDHVDGQDGYHFDYASENEDDGEDAESESYPE